jgi:hypothetical protein
MNVYHRNTNPRFILLWSMSILLITGFIFFTVKESFLTALLILGLTVIAGSIKTHGLTISRKSISIRRYYAFGVKKIEFAISPGRHNDIEFWEHGNLDNTADTDSWLDIFFIPALFVAGKRGATFKTVSAESHVKSLRIYLNNKEYQLIREMMQ